MPSRQLPVPFGRMRQRARCIREHARRALEVTVYGGLYSLASQRQWAITPEGGVDRRQSTALGHHSSNDCGCRGSERRTASRD